MSADQFDLERFVTAQAPVFATALEELRQGRKRSHWMWFIFPQLRGLGRSPAAQFYGISGLAEAQAYLAHPLLGPRLELATEAALAIAGKSLSEIFGSPDDLKFQSCVTLFAGVGNGSPGPYREALDRFCAGRMDKATLSLLGRRQDEKG